MVGNMVMSYDQLQILFHHQLLAFIVIKFSNLSISIKADLLVRFT